MKKLGTFRDCATLVSGLALAGCVGQTHRYGNDWYGEGPAYRGQEYRMRDNGYGPTPAGAPYFRGEGSTVLDPWLAFTPEGREIISRGFRVREGRLTAKMAHRANVWFRRYADTNRDLALTDPEIRVALVQAARTDGSLFY